MPVFLYLGEDDFTKKEALVDLKAQIGPPEEIASNVSLMEGAQLTLDQLIQVCSTVPFLAPGRLVVVTGLLARFGSTDPRRGTGRRRRSKDGEKNGTLGSWAHLRSYLEEEFPSTTTLVLMDTAVKKENPLLAELQAVAQVRYFSPLSREGLYSWLRKRMREKRQSISVESVELLVKLVGNDLWALSQEVEKLSLFTQGSRSIQVEDVRLLVAGGQEPMVFRFIDAALDGKSSQALSSLQSLLQDGATAGYVLGMLSRQVRLLLEAQEFLIQRLTPEQLGDKLGVRSGFPLQKLLEQSRRHSTEQLYAFHQALLEADVAIKRGALGETIALELLTGQLSGLTG